MLRVFAVKCSWKLLFKQQEIERSKEVADRIRHLVPYMILTAENYCSACTCTEGKPLGLSGEH